MEIVRRWKIQKQGRRWFVYSRPTDRIIDWQYLNHYPTFEEARVGVDRIVTFYARLSTSYKKNRNRNDEKL